MAKSPTELEAAVEALLARRAKGNAPLHIWVRNVVSRFEQRFATIADPAERQRARRDAFIFIRASLDEWALRPPHGD